MIRSWKLRGPRGKPGSDATQVNADWNAVSGIAQILNRPVVKRMEGYSGSTDANGLFIVTYGSAFAARPIVQPEPPAAANQVWVLVSSTATGFSLRLTQRSSVTILGIEVLLAATTNVASAAARVLVVEA